MQDRSQRYFGEQKEDDNDLEGRTAHPMGLMRLDQVLCCFQKD
jgi:hypothetical protein